MNIKIPNIAYDRRRISSSKTPVGMRRLSVENLEPRLVLDSTVVFNEIMYHPAGDQGFLKWVELHNQMAVDMDVSDWSVTGSKEYLGTTVVYNDQQVFYDAGARRAGSGHGLGSYRVGFRIRFNSDQLFRGVHGSVTIDRSARPGTIASGSEELLYNQIAHHAGGCLSSRYDDVAYIEAPAADKSNMSTLKMARYTDLFLNSQYPNGAAGDVFEYEIAYYVTRTENDDPEGRKLWNWFEVGANPGSGSGTEFTDLGDGKEAYRPYFEIRNNRGADNYDRLIQLAKLFGQSSVTAEQAEQLLDVDLWMRELAVLLLAGSVDTYYFGNIHNMWVYFRPKDGKALWLPWDQDYNFKRPATAPLVGDTNANVHKAVAIPQNLRLLYGHMHDVINTTYNNVYLDPWIDHYTVVTQRDVSATLKSYVAVRANHVTNQLPSLVPQVPFEVTTNGGADFSVDGIAATLEGTGWVNVREIRPAGSDQPFGVNWTNVNTWQLDVPVGFGANPIVLEAYDFQGNLIGSDTISITSTVTDPRVQDFLRITEINYNPAEPSASELVAIPDLNNDDLEFVEVQNIGTTSINLAGVKLQDDDGLSFDFPVIQLAAGERGVVVRDPTAFQLRYGDAGINLLGQYSGGGLSNGGDRLMLLDGIGTAILDFRYDDTDPWLVRADGHGASLELIDPANTPTDQYGKYYHWRGSTEQHGTPTVAGIGPVGVVINEVLANSDVLAQSDSIELFSATAFMIDIGGWWLSDSSASFSKYEILVGTSIAAGGYLVFDENDFNPNPGVGSSFALSGARGDDVWLVNPNGGGPGVLWLVDDVHFGASTSGESWGRTPNGSGRLAPMQNLTLGTDNSLPRVGPLVIGELNYHSGDPAPVALATDPSLVSAQLEFVEIFNPTSQSVDLTNWRIRGGVDFDFDTGASIGPGDTLVLVSFNPNDAASAARLAAFREHYGIDASVTLVGPYVGQLNNAGERVELQRPDALPLDDPTLIPRLQEDKVLYDDLAPWPTAADGTGSSLQRNSSLGYGNDPADWTATVATPGTFASGILGDLNGDESTRGVCA